MLENISIEGKPSSEAQVLELFAQARKDFTFIDIPAPEGLVTVQWNPFRNGWQILLTHADGSNEMAEKNFSPSEIIEWWSGDFRSGNWYAGQTWRREDMTRGKTVKRMILLLIAGLLLTALGLYLVFLGTN